MQFCKTLKVFTELLVEPIYYKNDFERVELRLSVDSRNNYYFRFGKAFYDSMSEQWFPTKEGATLPLSVDTGQSLLAAMAKFLALAESKGIIEKVLK